MAMLGVMKAVGVGLPHLDEFRLYREDETLLKTIPYWPKGEAPREMGYREFHPTIQPIRIQFVPGPGTRKGK